MSSANKRRTAAKQRRRRVMLRELCWRPRLCEVRWDDGCKGMATDPHEPLLRGRGGAIDDPLNVVLACGHCHDQVHRYPQEATRRGWMVPSGVTPELETYPAPAVVVLDVPDPF